MSLAPTAAGVRLVEKLRKMTGNPQPIVPPVDAGQTAKEAAQKQGEEMEKDPRYGKDRRFTAEADRAYMAAF